MTPTLVSTTAGQVPGYTTPAGTAALETLAVDLAVEAGNPGTVLVVLLAAGIFLWMVFK
jgi:hypothetical protein